MGRQPLTSPQFAILLAATRVPGSDQASIAHLSSLDTSTTSEVVRRLARQRQVTVQRDPEDGRRSRIFVSKSAAVQVESYLENLESADRRILACLAKRDQRAFLSALRALAYRNHTEAPSALQAAAATRIDLAEAETNYAFGRLIRIVAQQFSASWEEVEKDVSAAAFEVLRLAQRAPGVSQNLVGRALYIDRATMNAIASRLIRQELLATRMSELDRRRKELVLTDKGRVALRRLIALRNRINTAFVSPLTPEDQHVFFSSLNRVIAAVQNREHAWLPGEFPEPVRASTSA